MIDSFPDETKLLQIQKEDPAAIVPLYLQAIAKLEEQAAEIANLEAERERADTHYRDAVHHFHQLQARFEYHYSRQYQEYFLLPIPCYTWQMEEEKIQLLDFNPAAAQFSRETLRQPTLNLGQLPEKTFFTVPNLHRYLISCYQSQSSSSQRIQAPHLNLYLRVEYAFIQPNQVLMFIIDESEQVISEQQLRQRVRQQSAIAKLGQISINTPNIDKLFRQAVIFAARTLELSHSCIYRKQPNIPTCLLEAGYGWPVDLIGSVTVSSRNDSHIGFTFEQQEPVVITDLRLEQRFRGETLLHNYRVISGVSVIIGNLEQPWGALAVYNLEERTFTGDEIHFLQAIAHVLASAVERDRQASEMNLLHRSIDVISQGIVITDAREQDNPTIYVNRGFEEITGYQQSEILGRNCNFLQGRDRQQPPLAELRAAIFKGQPCRVTLRNYRKTGEAFWNELQIFPVRDEYGYLTNFIGLQTDVSEQKAAKDRLQKTEEQFRYTFDLAPIGMAITSLDGLYEQVNQAWCKILGYSAEELLAKSYLELTHPEDRAEDITYDQAFKAGEISQFQREKRYITKDGTVIYSLMQAALVQDAQGTTLHVIRQMVDISDRKKMEQQLVHEAFYDHLTGLPNRVLLQERLQQSIKRRQRNPQNNFAVLFLDLDHFKWVNDTMGHYVGDLLLQSVAERVNDCLRDTDTLARLGGDEFVVLLDEVYRETYALQISQRIHKALERPFDLAGQQVYVEVSIGILQGSETYDNSDTILRDADVAMYRAKAKGRSRSEVFDKTLQAQMSNRRYLEQQLREAIANNGLQVCYQPVVDLETGKLTGFAAQVRWEHKDQGWIPPECFLAIAEETGLILPLTRWTITTICQHLQIWQTQVPESTLLLFLPIASRQLRGGHFMDLLKTMAKEKGNLFHQFIFEFNETVLATAEQETRQQLLQIRQLGIHIFLNGFGTSNMSLNSLSHQLIHGLILEPDLLLSQDTLLPSSTLQDRHSILEAMISLAHTLNLEILVQGIQTQNQWQKLRHLNCPLGQGTLFGDYQSLEKATQLLQHQWEFSPASTV